MKHEKTIALAVMETLNNRQLLSASLAAGQLTVTGTGVADTINLTIVGGTTLRVVDNGVNRNFTLASVTKILVNVGDGADTVTTSDSITLPVTINGGIGNDTLGGGGGKDLINGDAGDDKLDGRANKDTINGGTDNDSISGGSGADSLSGNDGKDTIWAFRDTFANTDDLDTISGGSNNDTLYGSSGRDTINGDSGNDFIVTAKYWDGVLNPATGIDIAHGGEGNDRVDSFGINSHATLTGDAGDDSLIGGYGSDSLDGGIGNDTVDGVQGVDILHGGDGDDDISNFSGGSVGFHATLFGDAGDDYLHTIPGPDQVYYGGSGDDIIVGRGLLNGDGDNDILTGAGTLHGGLGNDQLSSHEAGTKLFGDEGNDSFYVQDGNAQTVDGGSGKDVADLDFGTDTKSNIEIFI